jgi:hypothetical protein
VRRPFRLRCASFGAALVRKRVSSQESEPREKQGLLKEIEKSFKKKRVMNFKHDGLSLKEFLKKMAEEKKERTPEFQETMKVLCQVFGRPRMEALWKEVRDELRPKD